MVAVNEDRIELGKDFTLWVEASGDDGGRQKMPVQARSIWLARDSNTQFLKTGFYLKDTFGEDARGHSSDGGGVWSTPGKSPAWLKTKSLQSSMRASLRANSVEA